MAGSYLVYYFVTVDLFNNSDNALKKCNIGILMIILFAVKQYLIKVSLNSFLTSPNGIQEYRLEYSCIFMNKIQEHA